jgi:hypothetical protein
VHCLVPGVGLTAEGRIVYSRPSYLVPVKALSAVFRGRFMAQARKALAAQDWPEETWQR